MHSWIKEHHIPINTNMCVDVCVCVCVYVCVCIRDHNQITEIQDFNRLYKCLCACLCWCKCVCVSVTTHPQKKKVQSLAVLLTISRQ